MSENTLSFETTLRLAGLNPRSVEPDGRWHRCPTEDKPRKKNGAYKLDLDGRHGVYRNWAVHAELQHWDAGRDPGVTGPSQRDRERMAAARERERQERRMAIVRARELWASGASYRVHKYLRDKGLSAQGCHGLRLWQGDVWIDRGSKVNDEWLLVPMYWRDKLVNVQRIGTGGLKRFMKDAPKKGCYFVLGRPRWGLTVICEGLSTGLAIYQSMPLARVVVAFDAGNLLPVTQELKPSGAVVFAADNDTDTFRRLGKNPGIEHATNAAELIGAGVAYPKDILKSDWADALKEWGFHGPKRIEREIMAAAKYVMPQAGATA